MINLQDHIEEIDGVKYVPLEVVDKYIAETYTKQVGEINKLMTKAFTDYDNSLKDIMND
jgi:hypothetical protein